MEEKIKIIKRKCDICGKTIRRVARPEDGQNDVFIGVPYKKNGLDYTICRECENKYKVTDGFNNRGYGYRGNTYPKRTKLDKASTPTYGVELEVAGNIKNIDKISKLAQNEVTIGYDSSVDGAMYELSYCPGTYYWYLYESNLRGVCALLSKDIWVDKESTTAGMHIHVGTINKKHLLESFIMENVKNQLFQMMIRIFGERPFNQYCQWQFLRGHHDAISWSDRWNTLEFRIFRMEYNFEKIMSRIKFIRQMIENSNEYGIDWKNFKEDSKQYFFELLQKARCIDKEGKEAIRKLFETEQEQTKPTPPYDRETEIALERLSDIEEYGYYRNEDEENEEDEDEEEGW